MEKSICYIQLKDGPAEVKGYGKKQMFGRGFCYWAEGLQIINIVFLFVAQFNQTIFVSSNGAIRVSFNFEDPFNAYDMLIGARGCQSPRTL